MDESREYTIADVAKRAGVSISTVSRILNGKQDVAAATRERVKQVIDELGYTPHAQARSLRAGKTHSIAMVFPQKNPATTPFNPLDLEFMVGSATAAGERSFFFNLVTAHLNKRALLEMVRSAQVDGAILMQIHVQDWRVELLREKGFPFVMIGHAAENTGISFVDLDFEMAAQVAFEHLIGLGHRQIAFWGTLANSTKPAMARRCAPGRAAKPR
ncbi:MAG: LacI family DNA-binding transcriptional regulator [Chloroflexi bacterium]|nr:LacI family DNA-binding transcriptional regulator [Chloroflexota bacterium]